MTSQSSLVKATSLLITTTVTVNEISLKINRLKDIPLNINIIIIIINIYNSSSSNRNNRQRDRINSISISLSIKVFYILNSPRACLATLPKCNNHRLPNFFLRYLLKLLLVCHSRNSNSSLNKIFLLQDQNPQSFLSLSVISPLI